MKLIILGLLMEGEKHPYEIQQAIKEREMERYIKFPKGSLYYTVSKLEENEFIEVARIESENNRPSKTIYRITEAGRAEFESGLLKQLAIKEFLYNPIYAALSFLKYGDSHKIKLVLEERISKGEFILAKLHKTYEEHLPCISHSMLHIIASSIEHQKVELKLLKSLLADIAADRLHEVGIPIVYEGEKNYV